jgi:hypothetical protein
MNVMGLISGALGGAAKGYNEYATSELKKQQEIDLAKQLLEAQEEKQLRIDEIRRQRDIADIPLKAQATADAAPVLARGEALGQVEKTSTPGYLSAIQSEADVKESSSLKALRGAQMDNLAADSERDRAYARMLGEGGGAGKGKPSKEKLTTTINSANAAIKSLLDGPRGKTPEEKANWQKELDEWTGLRSWAKDQIRENYSSGSETLPPPPKPGSTTNSQNSTSQSKKTAPLDSFWLN